MDGHKFDDLVKRICTTRLTRGSALRGLAAGVAAALTGGRFGSRGVAANEPVACKCTDDLSPKQCPKNSGIQFTCKLCKGITQGSVQVGCEGDKPFCFCQSTKCVVGGTTFKKDERVTVCKPVKCPTTDNCDDGDKCTIDKCVDGICEHTPVVCEPKDKCERCKCFPDKGCVCTPVVCKPDDQCEKDCECDPEKGCVCKPVVCKPKDQCEKDCECDPEKGCVCKPVVCKPTHQCEKDCECDPEKGCVCKPVECKPKDACETCICDKEKGCVCKPVVCPPRPGCDVKCDPVKGCVYTCVCQEGESPKGCPNPGDTPQYTCKRCPGGNNGGSVQVECNGTTPKCVCNSTECTIGTTTVPRGTDVTNICPPVRCDTGRPV